MTAELAVVPALRVRQTLQIITTHGQQVVDTWCFHSDDPRPF